MTWLRTKIANGLAWLAGKIRPQGGGPGPFVPPE